MSLQARIGQQVSACRSQFIERPSLAPDSCGISTLPRELHFKARVFFGTESKVSPETVGHYPFKRTERELKIRNNQERQEGLGSSLERKDWAKKVLPLSSVTTY